MMMRGGEIRVRGCSLRECVAPRLDLTWPPVQYGTPSSLKSDRVGRVGRVSRLSRVGCRIRPYFTISIWNQNIYSWFRDYDGRYMEKVSQNNWWNVMFWESRRWIFLSTKCHWFPSWIFSDDIERIVSVPFLLFVFEKFMAAIDRDRVDQLHTESFSWKLIIAEDQKVIDRTLLRWRNSNDFADPQCHRGFDSALTIHCWIWWLSLWERWTSAREDYWSPSFFFFSHRKISQIPIRSGIFAPRKC